MSKKMIALFYLSLQILKLYSYIVIANVVISWLVAFNVLNTSNRFVYLVLDFTFRLTEPFLRNIRGFLPNLGAIDISQLSFFVDMVYRNVYETLYSTINFLILNDYYRRKKTVRDLRLDLKSEVDNLKKFNRVPGLTVILLVNMRLVRFMYVIKKHQQ